MKLIVITLPTFVSNEASLIRTVLEHGATYVHIRKPNAKSSDVCRLIEQVGNDFRSRLCVHNHHDVAVKMQTGGLHLNSIAPTPPDNWGGRLSQSCHSLKEAQQCTCDYHFLSPIFNSVSKKGYASAFSQADIEKAALEGIITPQTIALGGITPDKVQWLNNQHFGGVAILGYAWQELSTRAIGNAIDNFMKTSLFDYE
ncbi:MAG: thiamine phosphate synthase [Bacteroidales bacterium]|nr:thiamine phosphate synthase [Bacteroidales bacterium]